MRIDTDFTLEKKNGKLPAPSASGDLSHDLARHRPHRLLDGLTFGYLGFITLFVLWFHTRIDGWQFYVLAHLATAAFLLGFFKLSSMVRWRIVRFFREIYPLVLFSFTFKEVSLLINDLFPFWFEPYLLAVDRWLTGGYPTVLLQEFYKPWLTEVMAFSYWSYYPIFLLVSLIFFIGKEWRMLRSLAVHLSLTMYACYFFYLGLPARGPKDTLAFLHLSRQPAGFFDNMVLQIQSAASIHGNAFPSSHVAAVWVILIFLFRYRRWLGLAVSPLVLALTISTVYLQYHYLADGMAGASLALLIYPLGRMIEKRMG